MLRAQTQMQLPDARQIVEQLCAHFVEHGAEHDIEGSAIVVTFPFGRGWFHLDGDQLGLDVESETLVGLHYMRMATAGHLIEYAKEPPEFVWRGDAADLDTPPNFRILSVLAITDLTPHMRRIRFSGSDLAMFAGRQALHVTLAFPAEGAQAVIPRLGANGMIQWPEDRARPVLRHYTIREIDAQAGWLDIDFVLHTDAGPGSDFAASALEGQMIAMTGPGGGTAPSDRDWYLLAGDETALPAIARILSFLPDTAQGLAVIEVADHAEEQPLIAPSGFEIKWLHRGTASFAETVKAVAFPPEGRSPFVWIGCEHRDFVTLRRHIRALPSLTKRDHLVMSYWRKDGGEPDED